MTIGATDMGVTPKEGEASLMGMIELLRVPVRSGMAVAAFLALVAFVNVIGRVATEAFCGQARVLRADVTGWAGGLDMFPGQCEGRLVMVEVRALPGLCVVAGGAVRPQSAAVCVVLRMTATTSRGCGAIGVDYGPSGQAALVAALASRREVGIVECEVRELVSESNLAQSRDIGLSAQVLSVTSAALTAGGLAHATVITAFRTNIRGDFFVAGQASRALPLTIGEVVTERAFGLDSGMHMGDRARHDEFLDAGCPGAWAEQQHGAREDKCSRVVV